MNIDMNENKNKKEKRKKKKKKLTVSLIKCAEEKRGGWKTARGTKFWGPFDCDAVISQSFMQFWELFF